MFILNVIASIACLSGIVLPTPPSLKGKKFVRTEPYKNEDYDMFKIGLKLEQKHNINLLLATPNLGGGLHQWGLRFTSDKQLTLEESEELIAHVLADFMELVRSDKKLLEERVGWVHPERPGADLYFRDHPCDPRYFFMRLTFWDKDLNRILPPYVAHIKVVKSKVRFYFADPKTQELRKHVEYDLQELLAKYTQGN